MKARKLVALALGALVAAAGACGGKLGDRSDSKNESTDQEATGGRGGDRDAAQAGAGDGPSSTRQLEACTPGFLHREAPAKPCLYITDDGRCYDTVEQACDCACPREGHPTCVWYAFLDPIEVTCENE